MPDRIGAELRITFPGSESSREDRLISVIKALTIVVIILASLMVLLLGGSVLVSLVLRLIVQVV